MENSKAGIDDHDAINNIIETGIEGLRQSTITIQELGKLAEFVQQDGLDFFTYCPEQASSLRLPKGTRFYGV